VSNGRRQLFGSCESRSIRRAPRTAAAPCEERSLAVAAPNSLLDPVITTSYPSLLSRMSFPILVSLVRVPWEHASLSNPARSEAGSTILPNCCPIERKAKMKASRNARTGLHASGQAGSERGGRVEGNHATASRAKHSVNEAAGGLRFPATNRIASVDRVAEIGKF